MILCYPFNLSNGKWFAKKKNKCSDNNIKSVERNYFRFFKKYYQNMYLNGMISWLNKLVFT